MKLKKAASALMLMGAVSAADADVCKFAPGSITCGKGTISSLSGNGMVTVDGTTVEGETHINGLLNADNSNFSSININGSASFFQCTINHAAEIKGALKASSTKFEMSVDIFSRSIKLINSKIRENLRIHHTDNNQQEVYLDNNSEVSGNIVFDDGHGKVFVRSGSKIGGNIIGGIVINK